MVLDLQDMKKELLETQANFHSTKEVLQIEK